MELDVITHNNQQKTNRKKRAQRMQAGRDNDVVGGGELESGEEDYEILKQNKVPRSLARRKRSKDASPILEEDIIDGFAILSFKTYEDLEVSVNF